MALGCDDNEWRRFGRPILKENLGNADEIGVEELSNINFDGTLSWFLSCRYPKSISTRWRKILKLQFYFRIAFLLINWKKVMEIFVRTLTFFSIEWKRRYRQMAAASVVKHFRKFYRISHHFPQAFRWKFFTFLSNILFKGDCLWLVCINPRLEVATKKEVWGGYIGQSYWPCQIFKTGDYAFRKRFLHNINFEGSIYISMDIACQFVLCSCLVYISQVWLKYDAIYVWLILRQLVQSAKSTYDQVIEFICLRIIK